MGVCLGKLHGGGRSVEASPPPLPPSPLAAPPPPQPSSVDGNLNKPSKPNHVAPHPSTLPTIGENPLVPSTASSTRSLSGSGRPRPLARANTGTLAVMRTGKRATITVTVPTGDSLLMPSASAASPLDEASSIVPQSKTASPPGRHMSVRPELLRAGSDGRRGFRKASKATLDVLFKDERARIGFFRFLEATSRRSSSETIDEDESVPPLKRRPSRLDYRHDCVLFWLEISDLLKIPSGGTFHFGLMQDLFDVYVEKNAPRALPMVSSAEREPLAQYLADFQADRALLAFKMLLLDVLEVVTAAFDEFVRCDTPLGFETVTRNESMRNVLSRLVKANVGAPAADRRTQLHDILHTPAVCRMFREFLQERNSVENLLFIIDALAFEDLVNSFEAESHSVSDADVGTRHEYCLRQAQKIFNKYIRYGSKAEICLSGAVKAKLLQSIVEYPLASQVFNDAVLLCCAELVQSHLDVFYRSRAYVDYQAARQAAAKAARATSSPGRRRSVQAPTEELSATIAQPIDHDAPTLSEILHSVGVNFFRDFLKDEGMESTLLFYKEVEQFQLLPHGQKHYIQIRARRIFDRFVRRGGKLEIELPLDVRRDILFKLSSPSEFTFVDALKYVVNLWEATYLPKFRSHPTFKDMRAAMDANPATSSTVAASAVDLATRRENQPPVAPPPATSSGPLSLPMGHGHSDAVDISKITLREFLELELLRKYFRHFLEKEQCLNELHFYFEIATFQQLPTSDYLVRQARKLYNRFCDPQSRECVVLRDDLRTELQASLERPSPAMFHKTQDEIFGFFQSTLFPKFQQSEIYRSIQITHAQIRSAQQAAMGFGDTDVRADRTASGDLGATATSARTTMGRRSVGAVVAVPELDEATVTVAMILENQDTRSLFLLFAEEIFCTESIYFWIDCNEFKDIPHRNYLKLRAQKIYRKYICGRAKLQVNLESAITKDIVTNLDDPPRTLFIVAQRSITKMLERDTLPKFRKSKHYQPCLLILKTALVKPTRG